MNRTYRLLILVLVIFIAALVFWSQGSRRPSALAKYKAELGAKGERLTWAELGYPRPAETNQSLERLLAAVATLPAATFEPGQLEHMPFVGPGRAQPSWSLAEPRRNASSQATNSLTWSELDSEMQKAGDALAEIRAAVENPARYFWLNPEDFMNWPGGSFVQKRKAAQWLAADATSASRAGQSARAHADLHAMIQLAQLHWDEFTLVNQMIRVAVAGLALSTTWEALQTNDWNDASLAALQSDWEQVDLLAAINRGILGERAQGEAVFAWLRRVSSGECMKIIKGTPATPGPPPLNSADDYLSAFVLLPLWRMNSEADELFFLQHHQRFLESLRKIDGTKPWPEIAAELKAHEGALGNLSGNPMDKIRYFFSLMIIPATSRAAITAVRHETQRRLTVTAIAVDRYRLRHGQPPPDLAALVPEFLSAVPLDPMCGEPLRYRLNADGSFVLYSVGEDGRDNGGDTSLSSSTNKFDLWSGKDAVWPEAEVPRQ